jgi:hypothetical protein
MKYLLSLLLLLLPLTTFASVQGASTYSNASLTATLVVASASPVALCNYNVSNTNTGTIYVQFFDAATTVGITLGVTAPKFWIAVPSGNGVTDGPYTPPVAFQNGIVIAVTTTPTGSTAPSSSVPVTLTTN